jgi:hypothetical protein
VLGREVELAAMAVSTGTGEVTSSLGIVGLRISGSAGGSGSGTTTVLWIS